MDRRYLKAVFNRRAFMLKLTESINLDSSPSAMLMIDIDFFKTINDNFGHQSGDIMLNHVLSVIRRELRDIDIVGRVGGEEFAVFLSQTSIPQAKQIAKRLCASIETTPCYLNGESVYVTISIGLTGIAADDKEYKNIFQRSDKAMYHSKKCGRNRVSVYEFDLQSE
jgi:diguanylate cyclase (GGDEF)-like protein